MNWWLNSSGYLEGRIEGKHVKQHRWVMERHLGRALASHEIVHHVNGNRTDNDPNNLEIMSRSEHIKHHPRPTPGNPAPLIHYRKTRGPWNKGQTSLVDAVCSICQATFQRKGSELAKAQRRGWATCCSKRCRGKRAVQIRFAQAKGEA